MDIAGAKALKERLGKNGGDEVPDPSVDVPEDAPPVYHWLGVSNASAEAPPTDTEDGGAAKSVSLFRRLGLSSP